MALHIPLLSGYVIFPKASEPSSSKATENKTYQNHHSMFFSCSFSSQAKWCCCSCRTALEPSIHIWYFIKSYNNRSSFFSIKKWVKYNIKQVSGLVSQVNCQVFCLYFSKQKSHSCAGDLHRINLNEIELLCQKVSHSPFQTMRSCTTKKISKMTPKERRASQEILVSVRECWKRADLFRAREAGP